MPYLDFDVEKCAAYARDINPEIQIFTVSATSGEGLNNWYGWLRTQVEGVAVSQV